MQAGADVDRMLGDLAVTTGPAPTMLEALQMLPTPLVHAHIWSRLSRRDKGAVRATCHSTREWIGRELLIDLRVRVSGELLAFLADQSGGLHSLFPCARSIDLSHASPNAASLSTQRATTADVSMLLTALGKCPSLHQLTVSRWLELTARDFQRIAAAYPNLRELAISGFPSYSFLTQRSYLGLASLASLRSLTIDAGILMHIQVSQPTD